MSESAWIRGMSTDGNTLGVDVGRRICDALGLKMVVSLRIDLHAEEFAKVTVEQYMTEQQVLAVETVLRELVLVDPGVLGGVTFHPLASAECVRSDSQGHRG